MPYEALNNHRHKSSASEGEALQEKDKDAWKYR
jgi:hypothetical protein